MTHSNVHPAPGKKPSPPVATHTAHGHLAIAKAVLMRLRVGAKGGTAGDLNMAIQSLEELGKLLAEKPGL